MESHRSRKGRFVRMWQVTAIVLVVAAQLACQATGSGSGQSGPSQPSVNQPAATMVPPTPIPPPTAAAEPATAPPSTQVRNQAPAGMACVGSAASGMSCLTDTGWQLFNTRNSGLGSDSLLNMGVCKGEILIVGGLDLTSFDGQNFNKFSHGLRGDVPRSVACDPNGVPWLALTRNIAFQDNLGWKTFSLDEIRTGGAPTDLVEDIGFAPDGKVWVVLSSQVTVYDGATWQVSSDGLEGVRFMKSIVFDSRGLPWVSYNGGVYSFDGSQWQAIKNPDLKGVVAMDIDAQDRLWLGTREDGVFRYEGGKWTQFNLQELGVSSNKIRQVRVDDNARVWVGTEWGLGVYDGSSWTAYRMENADLADNDIKSLAVLAGGPALVGAATKAPGTLSGRVLDQNRNPIPNAPIELCVESLGTIFYGDTPCSTQPLVIKAQSDAEGRFTISDVPAGMYIITIFANGGWAQLTGQFSLFSERVLVEAGKETDIGDLTLQ